MSLKPGIYHRGRCVVLGWFRAEGWLWPDTKRLVAFSRLTERVEGGALRCRHRIDRLKLPSPVHVFWVWKLDDADADASAPVIIKTATGTTRLPHDGLAGYVQSHWIAPRGFRIGGHSFKPHGPFAFARLSDHPGWLLAYVLSQNRLATFKGGEKTEMMFKDVYPGEEPVYEFAIDVSSVD